MAGRLALFLDACVRGAVAEGLLRRGFDIVRAVDVVGEGVKDPPLFAHAASLGRVFVTNDGPLHAVALEWLRAGKPFRMIYWPKVDDKLYTVGQILEAFEELFSQEDPFTGYPIVYLKPKPKR